MNEFGLRHIYTWKCHNETPCRAILNKQKCLLLFKNKEQKGKKGSFWGLAPEGGGGCKERV
jgi:hypothetical protein